MCACGLGEWGEGTLVGGGRVPGADLAPASSGCTAKWGGGRGGVGALTHGACRAVGGLRPRAGRAPRYAQRRLQATPVPSDG